MREKVAKWGFTKLEADFPDPQLTDILQRVRDVMEPFAHFSRQWKRQPLKGISDEFYGIHTGTEYEAALKVTDCHAVAEIIGDLAALQAEIEQLQATNADQARKLAVAVEALEEIQKCEGPFSRDPLTHAGNVIAQAESIAQAALKIIREDKDGHDQS